MNFVLHVENVILVKIGQLQMETLKVSFWESMWALAFFLATIWDKPQPILRGASISECLSLIEIITKPAYKIRLSPQDSSSQQTQINRKCYFSFLFFVCLFVWIATLDKMDRSTLYFMIRHLHWCPRLNMLHNKNFRQFSVLHLGTVFQTS